MATQYAFGKIVTDGLVLCLDAADRNSYVSGSTTWFDVAGSNNGTLTNGPTFNTGSGGSIVFDGTNDYVTGSCVLLNANSGSCMSMWVKTSSTTLQIISSYDNNTNSGFRFQIYNTRLYYTLGLVFDYDTGVNISDNTWKNIVASTSGSSALIYINGVLTNTFSIGIMLETTPNFRLGSWYGSDYFFTGNIATTQIYNRALTAQEVLQNFNAQKSRFGL